MRFFWKNLYYRMKALRIYRLFPPHFLAVAITNNHLNFEYRMYSQCANTKFKTISFEYIWIFFNPIPWNECHESKTAHSGTPNISIFLQFWIVKFWPKTLNSIQIMTPHRWCVLWMHDNRKRTRHSAHTHTHPQKYIHRIFYRLCMYLLKTFV